jgi:hypothetical protein
MKNQQHTKDLARLLMFMIFMISSTVPSISQGLFEEATADSSDSKKPYELNGYIRGVLYGGKVVEADDAELKSGYGEASLKLKISQKGWGDGFAEIRFRRGYEFGETVSELILREAYVNAYVGPLDFRIGHQVVVWGRADGINPTDNITPKNFLVRSPEEDDRREGNFLVRTYYNVPPFRFEAIWIPFYRSSVLPTELFKFPPGICLTEPDYPSARLGNSAFALKANLELARLDGSISYFNGYLSFPGLSAHILEMNTPEDKGISLFPKAYRMHVLGVDFSTTLGSLGLRGEFAFRMPHEDHETAVHIPHPDFYYVVGIEKELMRDFSMILQYIGRYVLDFTELEEPGTTAEMSIYELALINRMIASQQHEVSHTVSCRLCRTLMHQLLDIEILSMLNFTTRELMLHPRLTYDIADGLTITLGGEWYSGPRDTLYSRIDVHLSSIYTELKISF